MMTFQGAQRTRICNEDEFSSSGPFSPDGRIFYMICRGREDRQVVMRRYDTQTGAKEGVKLCDVGEIPRAFTWSQDRRYFYGSCGIEEGDQSDVLCRYDTQTGQVDCLTDPAQITYKAKRIVLSPDQSHLLILWGGGNDSPHPLSFLANEEPCGVWLLDLTKLGD